MSPDRRSLLTALALTALPHRAQAVNAAHALQFPRDFGAHPETALEWWYLTGLLGTDHAAPRYGYQLTVFRLRNPDPAVQAHASALAPRQILLGHVALSDLQRGRLLHGQATARGGPGARTAIDDCDVRLHDWRLQREGAPGASRYRAEFGSADFSLTLDLRSSQPPLLQGEAGLSRKSPQPAHVSRYYSQPQLRTEARLWLDGREQRLRGRSWLDHEWSDSLLDPDAVGWDWLGINFDEGASLTAFRLRRADGSTLWTGGSWRSAEGETISFAPGELHFEPGRRWRSPASQADYPVQWQLRTPQGDFALRALLDAQEIDARRSTGLLYWEGACELRGPQGRRLGLGYLEMTGYAGAMRLA